MSSITPLIANNVEITLAQGLGVTAGFALDANTTGSVNLTAGDGIILRDLLRAQYNENIITDTMNFFDLSKLSLTFSLTEGTLLGSEIVVVQDISFTADFMNVVRGSENSVIQQWPIGTKCEINVTADTMINLSKAAAASLLRDESGLPLMGVDENGKLENLFSAPSGN